MQEDMDAAQAGDASPDEQQLEVLEDIWLKAGEIDVGEANIYDEGYKVNNVGKRRKVRRKKNTGSAAAGDEDFNPKKLGKKKPGPKKRVINTVEDITNSGLFTPMDSANKKVCGPVVAPTSMLKTEDGIKSEPASCSELESSPDKKHKHKRHKEHKCKKHKKKVKEEEGGLPRTTSEDPDQTCSVINDIIKVATEEHEEFLKQKYTKNVKIEPKDHDELIVPKSERFEDNLKSYEVAVRRTLNTSADLAESNLTSNAPSQNKAYENQFLSFIKEEAGMTIQKKLEKKNSDEIRKILKIASSSKKDTSLLKKIRKPVKAGQMPILAKQDEIPVSTHDQMPQLAPQRGSAPQQLYKLPNSNLQQLVKMGSQMGTAGPPKGAPYHIKKLHYQITQRDQKNIITGAPKTVISGAPKTVLSGAHKQIYLTKVPAQHVPPAARQIPKQVMSPRQNFSPPPRISKPQNTPLSPKGPTAGPRLLSPTHHHQSMPPQTIIPQQISPRVVQGRSPSTWSGAPSSMVGSYPNLEVKQAVPKAEAPKVSVLTLPLTSEDKDRIKVYMGGDEPVQEAHLTKNDTSVYVKNAMVLCNGVLRQVPGTEIPSLKSDLVKFTKTLMDKDSTDKLTSDGEVLTLYKAPIETSYVSNEVVTPVLSTPHPVITGPTGHHPADLANHNGTQNQRNVQTNGSLPRSSIPKLPEQPLAPAPRTIVPNPMWQNQKYYSVNACNTVEFDNADRFYPLSMNPITFPDEKDLKVILEKKTQPTRQPYISEQEILKTMAESAKQITESYRKNLILAKSEGDDSSEIYSESQSDSEKTVSAREGSETSSTDDCSSSSDCETLASYAAKMKESEVMSSPMRKKRVYKKHKKQPWYDKIVAKKKLLEKKKMAKDTLREKVERLTPKRLGVKLDDIFRRMAPNLVKRLEEKETLRTFPRLPKEPKAKDNKDVLSPRTKVWAKKLNGRFYKGEAISHRNVTTYGVYILKDNSFVCNLPSDRVPRIRLPLKAGDRVDVILHDGKPYVGEYVYEKVQLFYKVIFDDNEVLEVLDESVLPDTDFSSLFIN